MNANELLFYLRGLCELVPEFTEAQIEAIRAEVLRAKPVDMLRQIQAGCGCGPKSA